MTYPEQDSKDSVSTPLVMQTMRWGIHYGKETSKGSQAINARSENLTEGVGMWNKFRGKNRCVVVCQGYSITFLLLCDAIDLRYRYYEWQTKGKNKLPHFTKHPDDKVMLMAGLYDESSDKSIAFYSTLSWLEKHHLYSRSSRADVHVCHCHYSRKQSSELVT